MHLKKEYIFLFLVALLIIIIFMIPFQRSIVINKMHSKEILAYVPVHQGDNIFAIQYTHSIHLTEVRESYKILKNNQIEQFELMYDDTSIGMPSEAENGETFVRENGHYYIKNMKRIFPSFNLSTGKVIANHRLIYKNKKYPFKKFIKPGTFITIQVKKLSLFQLLKGVNIVGKGTT